MKLSLEDLSSHLQSRLAPVYLVSGDETLLVGEACDAIRAQARAKGFATREVHFVERATDWAAIQATLATQSLFAEQRLLEIRPFTDVDGIQRCHLVLDPTVVRTRWQPRRAPASHPLRRSRCRVSAQSFTNAA